jgi:ABC-type transport system substrate-binding protein
MNEASCLGYCPPSGVIIPRVLDYALQTEPLPYDPQKARQLLAEAGYPNGFDAGELIPIPPFVVVAEAVVNYLNAVGIRVKMRPMERAAFYTAWREKKLRGLVLVASGRPATRPPVSRRLSPPKAPMHMRAIPISMSCTSDRRGSGTAPHAKPCYIASSSSRWSG